MRARLEVALPVRDRGVDLVACAERDVDELCVRLIQLKAFTGQGFSIDREYAKTPGLVVAYVWNLGSAAEAEVYAMECEEAVALAGEMGFTSTPSWRESGRYSVSRPGRGLVERIAPFRATAARWRHLLGVD